MATLTPTRAAGTQSLAAELREVAAIWSRSQHRLVVLAAEFADSTEWILDGSPTAAHWLADVADVEACTTREWIRIGRLLRSLPATADAFETRRLSYTKVRALTRIATKENETELVTLAEHVPASQLGHELAKWLNRTSSPEHIETLHRRQRSIKWRTDPDGMVTFTLRLPPLLAGTLIAMLTTLVMRTTRRPDASADAYPTLAQQHVDAFEQILTGGTGTINTEVIVHIRGDGNTLDDGTPIPGTIVEHIAPHAFLRVLIHDADTNPINASHRRRHPTTRQKRVVKERDRTCVDCGRALLLEYDHNPAYEQTRHTIIEELQLRCAPCHHNRHRTTEGSFMN